MKQCSKTCKHKNIWYELDILDANGDPNRTKTGLYAFENCKDCCSVLDIVEIDADSVGSELSKAIYKDGIKKAFKHERGSLLSWFVKTCY